MTAPTEGRPSHITVGAQFYDLRHRAQIEARADVIADGLASMGRTPRVGHLDFAAGTGVLTTTLARRWHGLPCWALEPSHGMRIALITTIAASPGLAERVTVLPGEASSLTRRGFVDVVTAMWCMHILRDHELEPVITALRDALVPGGVLVTETPRRLGPSAAPITQRGSVRLGEHTIDWDYHLHRDEDGTYDARYAYEWRDETGALLYADADRTGHGPEPFPDLPAVLRRTGFVDIGQIDDPLGGTLSVFTTPVSRGDRSEWHDREAVGPAVGRWASGEDEPVHEAGA